MARSAIGPLMRAVEIPKNVSRGMGDDLSIIDLFV